MKCEQANAPMMPQITQSDPRNLSGKTMLPKDENEHDLLRRAWVVQSGGHGEGQQSEDSNFRPIDVDAECMRAFEKRLFEYSPEAGEAGFYQWGLDAGDHQDRWDPYHRLPSSWFTGDYPTNDDELMEVRVFLAN